MGVVAAASVPLSRSDLFVVFLTEMQSAVTAVSPPSRALPRCWGREGLRQQFVSQGPPPTSGEDLEFCFFVKCVDT